MLVSLGCAATHANGESPKNTPAQEVGGDTSSTVPASDESRDSVSAASEVPDPIHVAIEGRSGSAMVGIAELSEVDGGVKVVVRVDDIEPGLHGVHIHETPDCSAADASSAGGHFNPTGHDHGLPTADARHLGDLGNMGAVAPDGKGVLEVVVPGATLAPDDANSFLNRALIVHADEDTGVQPSGNSGERVGCAELTVEQHQLHAKREQG